MDIINFAKPITGNFIVDIIIWLVGISSVTAGIILFTVLLKVVTLPFDFFSKASMRKNSLKMEEMRPELEKLQKQYADNKTLYNQKMMALYKKNGYSMFGACLPTILTLVIFIIALNGFSSYSQYQNRQYLYEMSNAYNNAVYYSLDTDDKYVVYDNENKKIAIDFTTLATETNNFTASSQDGKVLIVNDFDGVVSTTKEDSKIYIIYNSAETQNTNFYLQTSNSVVRYSAIVKITDKVESGEFKYNAIPEKLEEADENHPLACEQNNFFKNSSDSYFVIDTASEKSAVDQANAFIKDIREVKSAESFRENNASFLWVKNIWVSDSPMKHPIETDWNTFKATHAVPDDYNDVSNYYSSMISKLEVEKTAPNGYFILVILTAGISLVLQIVTTKSQKAQMELQTVNGQGASTQKMMTWIMPIMMAIFAFMYTAAFSIYIILSSVISILSTFAINAIIDRKFKKGKTETKKIRGRVYVPKEEEKPAPKKEKKAKKNAIPENSFLSGKADNKSVRGRK